MFVNIKPECGCQTVSGNVGKVLDSLDVSGADPQSAVSPQLRIVSGLSPDPAHPGHGAQVSQCQQSQDGQLYLRWQGR